MITVDPNKQKRYRFDFAVWDAAKPVYNRNGLIEAFEFVGMVNAHSDTHAIREAKKIALAPMVRIGK